MTSLPIHRVTPYFYSASQLSTFVLCPRKWGWEYINGFREPAGPAADLGTRVHKVQETWFEKGIPPDRHTAEGKIAAAGLEFLPLPSPHLRVEKKFSVRIGEHFYRGAKDLEFLSDSGVWVVDHKTTNDFMWQKTEEDLRGDIQAMLYAKHALDVYQVDEVTLMWLYYRTRGTPKAQPTIFTIGREDVEDGMAEIHRLADEVTRLRLRVLDATELPINAMACAAFGGCPHQQRCNLSTKDKMRSIMSQADKKMSVSEKMKAARDAREAGVNGSTPMPAAVAVPAAVAFNPPESALLESEEGDAADIPTPKRPIRRLAPMRPAAVAAAAATPTVPASAPTGSRLRTARAKPVQVEVPGTEADDEGEETETQQPEKTEGPRRGRPAGSKNLPRPEVTGQVLLFSSLFGGALAGGGHEDQIALARKLYEEGMELL